MIDYIATDIPGNASRILQKIKNTDLDDQHLFYHLIKHLSLMIMADIPPGVEHPPTVKI